MEDKIIIRRASPADLKELQDLFVSTISTVCKRDYNEEQIKVWVSGVTNVERWERIMNTQLVLVALIEEKIVGFCSLDNFSYIDMLFVDKDYQGVGVANKLYNLIEREASQNNTNELSSDVSITAKPFFERKGFEVIKEQNVVRNGVGLTNYKMIKKL